MLLDFDADQAYLHRKIIFQNFKPRSSVNSVQESQLARAIVHQWDKASNEVRQAYKQFIGAVVELLGGEVVSGEFREVAESVYRLFVAAVVDDNIQGIAEAKLNLQKLLGHTIEEANLLKVSSLAKTLFMIQNDDNATMPIPEWENREDDDMEIGADLDFNPPARFLVDISMEDVELQVEETSASSSCHIGWYEPDDSIGFRHPVNGGNYDLGWLRDACGKIVGGCTSQLPRDELAMAICRVLDSGKPGDEIAGDLLDLVGDNAFETVQDFIMLSARLYGSNMNWYKFSYI